MFKTKIIYKLILAFLVFAAMIMLPYTLTIINQTKKMIAAEDSLYPHENEEYAKMHREFVPTLIEKIVPFAIYTLIMAMFFSLFFMRKLLASLKELQRGSQKLKNGELDTRLEITSKDELGDVTEAFNEMAAALQQSTLELRKKDMYLNAMLDPLWVVDEENNIIDINPAFTRLFGHSREEVIGASIYDFLDDRNAAVMRSELFEKRERGLSSIYEINIFSKEGVQVPVLVSGSPLYSGDRITGKIGIFKDFRDQRDLRNELQQSMDYIETVMDSIEDQLLVVDKNYRVVRANRTAIANSATNPIGEFCHSVTHDSANPCWAEGMDCPAQKVFLTGNNYTTTHRHVGAGGEARYHEVVASPVKDSSGQVVHVIELLRDVTKRISHEEEIFMKNRELLALNSVAKLLSRSLKPDEIFAKVLDRIIEMMDMDGGGIFFIDEYKKDMVCLYHKGISDEYIRLMGRVRVGEDIPGKVAVTGQSMTSSDLSRDNRVDRSVIKHSGIKGYCCFPVRGKEKIIGVFCIFSLKTHVFTAEEENILSSIGEMTGVALENIRLYEKMKQLYETQRKRREDEHAHLLSISTRLGSAVELTGIMTPVLEIIKESFKADFAWMLISDNDGNLVLKSAASFKEKPGEVVYEKGISSIEGYSIETRQPAVIHNIKAADRFYVYEGLSELLLHDVVSVPMFIGKKPVGIYALYYTGRRDFTEEEIHFLQIIANFLAVALERSEYYSRSLAEKDLSEAILHSVADGIVTVNNSARVISVNTAFQKIIGKVPKDSIGTPICDLFRYSEETMEFRLLLGECLEHALSGTSAGREGVLTTAFGNTITVLINSYPVQEPNGMTKGAVTILRDISREKEIDRMKTELIRSVSHEFRTPLSAIVGMTEMIIDGDIEDNKREKYLGTILSEGIRLSSMVNDLLSIARIESGRESLQLKPLDLKSLLENVIGAFSSVIKRKKASVKYYIVEGEELIGDEDKITKLLLNFIDNSLSFSDNGCSVTISIRRRDDVMEIIVEDTGWGISESDLKHLTERFYRGLHGERVKGTGLGLSLCSEIVKMHGGDMKIKSIEGEGTSVTVTMPSRRNNG